MKFKKLLAVLLAAVCVMSSLMLSAGAVSITSGRKALLKTFTNAVASNGYDYLAFSPKKGEGDTQKYPLMVWLHGMKSGQKPGSQLQWYGFSNWASDEYQARFVQGGCYLLAPRACNATNNWDSSLASNLKKIIDEYIEQNKENIDTSRIYIGGYSTGGVMVWAMLARYPGFFAAGLPLASITQPATLELDSLQDTSVWIMCCDIDNYVGGRTTAARETFNYLKSITHRKSGIRITNMTQAVLANGAKKTETKNGQTVVASDAEHYVWEAVTYDMHMSDRVTPYLYATTVDGTGLTINFDDPEQGVISWLCRQSNKKTAENQSSGFFARIAAFFKKLFSLFLAFFK